MVYYGLDLPIMIGFNANKNLLGRDDFPFLSRRFVGKAPERYPEICITNCYRGLEGIMIGRSLVHKG